MAQRIAIASTDGQNINLHFGQAHQYYIYDLEEQAYRFVEVRKVSRILTHGSNEFDRVIALLQDCKAIFVGQIGFGAARYLAAKNIRIFEAPYSIPAVLDKLVAEKILQDESDQPKS